jgi:hypothetical protein
MSFISREQALSTINNYAQNLYQQGNWKMGETVDDCLDILKSLPDEYAVRIEEWNKLNFECNVLRALLNGEWVNCKDVQEAMNITFEQGKEMFDYGVCGPWNGQLVGEKFRIGEKTTSKITSYGIEECTEVKEASIAARTNPDTHQWELILEQQGGII